MRTSSPVPGPGPEAPVIIIPIHNVAITMATPSKAEAYIGHTINITVVTINNGNVNEILDIAVHCGTNFVGTQAVSNLAAGSEVTLTFSWDIKDVEPCQNLTIIAEASTVPDEVETADNIYSGCTVTIKMLGDVNGDGIIDINDVVMWAVAFGSQPGHPKWNPQADLYQDSIIDIFDGVIISVNFGKTYP